jgi:hypothetical protein
VQPLEALPRRLDHVGRSVDSDHLRDMAARRARSPAPCRILVPYFQDGIQ